MHVPVVCFMVYILYEVMMPENMNIRVDLLLLWPLLFLTGLLYIVKIVILLSKKEDIEDNKTLQQTAVNE
jgi:hypothetical protein